MIGYKMGSSLGRGSITVKTFLVETFKYGWKNDMDANTATLFPREVL